MDTAWHEVTREGTARKTLIPIITSRNLKQVPWSQQLLYFYVHLKDWGYICWKRHWGIQESQAHNNASISSICTSSPRTLTKHLCIFPGVFMFWSLFCFWQDHLLNAKLSVLIRNGKKTIDRKRWGGEWTECFHFHCKGIFPMQFFKDQMPPNAFGSCMEQASHWFF